MTRDPYRYFRVEARELCEQLGQGALDLEREPLPDDLVPKLLRLAHTLKGAARVVRQPGIAELAHAVEDALAPLREQKSGAPRELVDAILQQVDQIGACVAQLPPPDEADSSPSAKRAHPDESLHAPRPEVAELEALQNGIAEASVQLGRVRGSIGSLERARRIVDLIADHLPARSGAEKRGWPGSSPSKAQSLAAELREVLVVFERVLSGSVDQMERDMDAAREAAERLRLVPVSALFAPLARVARDSAQLAGRRVELDVRGGDVRLDAQLLAGVQGALVQLVRNAVAHGIEPESERVAHGKPAAGRVSIEVARRGTLVTFLCRDDGRGVDLEAVRRVAERKGLFEPAEREHGAEELIRLLLRGGLTTSREVTEAAGRGVGLDVVRDAAARLAGAVALRTEAGKGTTVELSVPVSLASLDALLVDTDGIVVAIPLDAVRATRRLGLGDVARMGSGEAIVHEGRAIGFAPLSRCLRREAKGERTATSAVLVASGAALAAFGIDRLLGTAKLLVRPLPELAPADAVVAGASLDAAGRPQLVLDSANLVAAVSRLESPSISAAPRARASILVVDDSLTTRMLERSILESAGYEVELATSAEEALVLARAKRYALFLVDVEMPGMSGFEYVECIRADPELREIPAILVTSRATADDRERGRAAGAEGYIVKSEFDQRELLERIERLLERSQA